jgi:hypothetical protein
VLAPPDDLWMQPPISWSVTCGFELSAELWLNWSPWLDATQPEGRAVRTAVERMRATGWELVEPVYELDLMP